MRTTDRRRGDVEQRAQRRADRRTALLDAARTAIRRHGARVSMDAIAAEAGVTKPIIYRHFGDREGLVAALADEFAADLLVAVTAALGADDDPRALLRATIDAYIAQVEESPELYAFLVRSVTAKGGASGPAGVTMGGLIPRIAREVTMVVGERLREAGHDSSLAEPFAYALVGMAHTVGDWWVERGTMPRHRLVDALVTLSWDGLSSFASEEESRG